MVHKTRIKICGMTRKSDILLAIRHGADAVGFVFYENSPRFLTVEQAHTLLQHIPPFIQTVGLFVNPTIEKIQQYCRAMPIDLLQFHGDESGEFCQAASQAVGKPYLKALRISPKMTEQDIRHLAQSYPHAKGLLLDAWSAAFGGSGKKFNWDVIPKEWIQPSKFTPPIILSGGINVTNVTEAINRIMPYGIDISSGVEDQPGIKNHQKLIEFLETVQAISPNNPNNSLLKSL